MVDFITLACPCCNGNLALTGDAERFACPYCRREHLIRRGERVSLVPIGEQLERVEQRVEQHASELAIYRLREEKQAVEVQIKQQNERVGDWNRARTQIEGDLAIAQLQFVAASGFALLAAVLTAVLCFTGGGVPNAWRAVSLVVSAFAGVVAFRSRARANGHTERLANTREILAELYRHLGGLTTELGRIETELGRHAQPAHRN